MISCVFTIRYRRDFSSMELSYKIKKTASREKDTALIRLAEPDHPCTTEYGFLLKTSFALASTFASMPE